MRILMAALLGFFLVCSCGAQVGDSSPDGSPTPVHPSDPRPDSGPGVDQHKTPLQASLGVVVIDVQDVFVSGAANKDINQIIDNTKAVLQLTASNETPLFVTYEHSKTAPGYTLPAKLKGVLPPHAREFIKTTFAATSLESFATALRQSGLTHLLVLGAETDVCVLQTVLGLRAMGHTVILLEDAVFTSEPNTAPALRRMKQASVLMSTTAQAQRYIEKTDPLPRVAEGAVRIVKPLAIGAVLNRLDEAAVAGSQDAFKQAKLARLRELLLISEWFDFPLYGTSVSLPATLKTVLKTNVIKPLGELGKNGAMQIIVAGSGEGGAALVGDLAQTHDVFIMEDGLLAAGGSNQAATLEQLYQGGAVPLTYKSLYYEMTRSIDPAQWPKAWVDRYDEYYNKTSAPEDLPPMK